MFPKGVSERCFRNLPQVVTNFSSRRMNVPNFILFFSFIFFNSMLAENKLQVGIAAVFRRGLSYASSKQTCCNQPIRTNRPIVRSFSSAMPPFQDPPTRRYVPDDKDNYLETNKRISRYLPRCTRPPDITSVSVGGKDMQNHLFRPKETGSLSLPIDLGVQLHPFLGFENYSILFLMFCLYFCLC